jgi:hypothetical protein
MIRLLFAYGNTGRFAEQDGKVIGINAEDTEDAESTEVG